MARARSAPDAAEVADQIHAAAIRLLRFVRKEDVAAGIGAPQLSALSVLVFQGPQALTELAVAEQVRLPTMSRLIADLETRGLVARKPDRFDRRISRISATAKGRTLLEEGRRRRLSRLVAALGNLPPSGLSEISAAAKAIMQAIARE